MPIQVEITNLKEAKAILAAIDRGITDGMQSVFRSLGDVYVADVKRRIISQNDGTWAPASKWLKAKTGGTRVLDGAEKYVKARISQKQLAIVSTARGWSLSDHDQGFTNKLVGPGDSLDKDGRVELTIRDPRPLNLYTELRKKRDGTSVPRSTTFAFKPTRAGVTPARQIWPTAEQAIKLGHPIASRWLTEIVKKAGGSVIHG